MKNLFKVRVMKQLLHLFKLACCGAALLAVACGNNSDYRDLLPADSFVTLSINQSSLSAKSGMADMIEHSLYTRLKSEIDSLEGLAPEEKEYLLTLLRTPEESGLDMERDQFLFVATGIPADGDLSSPMPQKFGVLLPLGDRAKFDTLIGLVCQKSGLAVKTEQGVSYLAIGESEPYSGLCAYDDRAVLFYFATGSSDAVLSDAVALFKQKRRESLMGKSDIASQLDRRNDINMVISYAGISSLLGDSMFSTLQMVEALKSVTVVGSVNFEQGEIVGDVTVCYADAESKRQIEEANSYITAQKGDLLRYVPENPIAVMGFGLDGAKLLDFVSSLPGGAMLVSNQQVAQVVKSFAGDVSVSFSGMSADGRYPVGSVLARIADPAVLDVIVANLAGMPLQANSKSSYTLVVGGVSIHFGIQDGIFYLTTDPAVKAALDGATFASFASREEIFREQDATIYFDFQRLNDLLTSYAGSSYWQSAVSSVLGLFDELEAFSTLDSSRMIVRMTDREQNALKSICDGVNELIVESLPEE